MERTADISLPVKVGLAVVGAGALLTFGYIFRSDPTALMVIVIGIALVALVLFAYRMILRRSDSRRARTASLEIAGATGRKPREINDPGELAKVADLARKFEEGLEKFRTAGKDLYSIPWYVLVGEPGSGKTEALRHCGVPTPTGLAELPGVGGTINMNWWFTNQAIVLDTAGRLMFQSVEPAKSGEWSEFLKLLAKARPSVPINGLLLVIPADSLIRDTNNKIEEKAKKIALQFDLIQRTLGVRFPVFVVITKSDLINGFREFFNTFTNPDAENQMLGWSNPAPLDAKFEPDEVDKHLESVRKRLLQYRAALLLDPVNTDDPGARRADQADALYAFPDSMMSIAPALRQYMELIFVQGEWSPKPLFLRGIYFTSSMREGSALDRELADLLGVPVDQLPEGKVWERNRAQFLKELFTKKVFREKGLVTRATNASGLQRRRKLIVMCAAFAAVAVMLVLTYLGSKQLKQDIVSHKDYWSDLRTSYTNPKTVVDSRQRIDDKYNWSILGGAFGADGAPLPNAYSYRGERKITFGDKDRPLREIHKEAVRRVPEPIAVPAVFKPIAGFRGNLVEDERAQAYRHLFEETVLKPLVKAAASKMAADAPWTEQNAEANTKALVELVRLEAGGASTASTSSQSLDLDALFQYVLVPDSRKKMTTDDDGRSLQQSFEVAYPAKAPPPAVALKGLAAGSLNAGVDRFTAYWSAQASTTSKRPGPVSDLRTEAMNYERALKDLAELSTANANGPDTLAKYQELYTDWKAKLAAVTKSRDAVDKLVQTIEQRPGGWAADATLLDLYRGELTIEASKARAAHQALLNEIPENAPAGMLATRNRLQTAMAALPDPKSLALPKEVVDELGRLQTGVLAKPDERKPRLYELYQVALKQADGQLPNPDTDAPAPAAPGGDDASSAPPTAAGAAGFVRRTDGLGAALKQVDQALKTAYAAVIADLPAASAKDTASAGADVRSAAGWAVRSMAGPFKRYRVINAVVSPGAGEDETAMGAPKSAKAIAAIVAATSQSSDELVIDTFPPIPMTPRGGAESKFKPEYHRKSGPAVIQAWLNVKRVIAPGTGAGKPRTDTLEGAKLAQSYADLTKSAFAPYIGEYVTYWSKCLDEGDDVKAASWAEYQKLLPANAATANEQLERLSIATYQALRGLEKMQGSPTDWNISAKIKKAAENAESAAAKLGLGTYQSQCGDMLTAWKDLGADPLNGLKAARQLGPRKFHDTYMMPPTTAGSANVVTSYWQNIAYTGLNLLVKSEAKGATVDLAAIRRFPLAPPKGGVGALSPEEVRDALDKIVEAIGADQGASAAIPTATAAGLEEPFAKLYDTLVGKAVAPDEAWLKQARRIASSLTAADGLHVTISTVKPSAQQADAAKLKNAQKTDVLAGDKIRSIEVAEGAGPVPAVGDESTPLVKDRAVAGAPGESVEFHFQRGEAPEAADDRFDERVSGAWAVLKLLYDPYTALPQDAEGKVWHVQLQPKQFVDNNPARHRVWVELKFDKPIVRFATPAPAAPAAAAVR